MKYLRPHFIRVRLPCFIYPCPGGLREPTIPCLHIDSANKHVVVGSQMGFEPFIPFGWITARPNYPTVGSIVYPINRQVKNWFQLGNFGLTGPVKTDVKKLAHCPCSSGRSGLLGPALGCVFGSGDGCNSIALNGYLVIP